MKETEFWVKGNIISTFVEFTVKRNIIYFINGNLRTFEALNELPKIISGKSKMLCKNYEFLTFPFDDYR